MTALKVALIGLDSSHTIEFCRRMLSRDCAPAMSVEGMKVTRCLRLPSAFRSESDQDKTQAILEEWNVEVTLDAEEAASGADAIMILANDPAAHWPCFQRIANFGKPIFLDKPPADTVENAQAIGRLAREKGVRIFSASSLRFAPEIVLLKSQLAAPRIAFSMGALDKAPKGSSIVWYGVHAAEMLQEMMGAGARSVHARKDEAGILATVDYSGGRRGMVQLTQGDYQYAIFAQDEKGKVFHAIDAAPLYTLLLHRIRDFFNGGEAPVAWEKSFEIQAILAAIEQSAAIGKEIAVET